MSEQAALCFRTPLKLGQKTSKNKLCTGPRQWHGTDRLIKSGLLSDFTGGGGAVWNSISTISKRLPKVSLLTQSDGSKAKGSSRCRKGQLMKGPFQNEAEVLTQSGDKVKKQSSCGRMRLTVDWTNQNSTSPLDSIQYRIVSSLKSSAIPNSTEDKFPLKIPRGWRWQTGNKCNPCWS